MSTSIEDLDFPKAVLTRMIKSSLPENINIQKEARIAASRASTVFVSYLAATANDCAREAGHKTIMPNDVFKALEAVGLGDFIDRLQNDLVAFNVLKEEKKELAAKNKAAENNEEAEIEVDAEDEEEDDDEGADMETENQPELSSENNPENVAPTLSKVSSEYMDVDENDTDNAKRPRIE